jgi:hypothetical protein
MSAIDKKCVQITHVVYGILPLLNVKFYLCFSNKFVCIGEFSQF